MLSIIISTRDLSVHDKYTIGRNKESSRTRNILLRGNSLRFLEVIETSLKINKQYY